MQSIYWNINNSFDSFQYLTSEIIANNILLASFSEYWEIYDQLADYKLRGYKIFLDPGKKRNGIIYSNSINLKIKKVERYYILSEIKYRTTNFYYYVFHCKSKLGSEEVANDLTMHLGSTINKEINEKKWKNVIMIGDFNQDNSSNVFSKFHSFNACNFYNSRSRDYLEVEKSNFLKFYNPTASFSGDLSPGPIGTIFHYFKTSPQRWFSFDHLLISYPFVKSIDLTSIRVVEELNGISLFSGSVPNKRISDHLPIIFRIN